MRPSFSCVPRKDVIQRDAIVEALPDQFRRRQRAEKIREPPVKERQHRARHVAIDGEFRQHAPPHQLAHCPALGALESVAAALLGA
jgi:hypothetical protein